MVVECHKHFYDSRNIDLVRTRVVVRNTLPVLDTIVVWPESVVVRRTILDYARATTHDT